MVTLTRAREVARQATRYGYSMVRNPSGDGWSATEATARCPQCREQVTAYKLPWDRSFTLVAWTKAFRDHLEDCPGT
jgi:hypothetical protein